MEIVGMFCLTILGILVLSLLGSSDMFAYKRSSSKGTVKNNGKYFPSRNDRIKEVNKSLKAPEEVKKPCLKVHKGGRIKW